ncbi:Bug family tripartite tricarboxylate transporter substrate binding protein [Cupriavidus basilensis]|uniref:Bug family tripartite tricarboxylate transporter substrate binding protein n=1 Tax=Cupriavidus TaxID=106589 RepID=UPI0004472460|nr:MULTISPECIES: tripartite tricarboxylate transporter substrate binding protein [Cupriavidus]KDP88881.1 LacI family transcriptional regulator [Cupriavidus sp. SK-3]MDF3888932.1 tripartite tricarboxylate transporter substrate binding protein [Cupriavidus basilensis]
MTKYTLNMGFLPGLLACAALPLALGAAPAAAAWPEKPIRLVVGFPPGGPVDTHARILAEKLQPILGQSVVLDYKAGAAGNIGSDAVAKAAPDGYTLLLANTGQMAINGSLYPKLPYAMPRDFAPVARTALIPLVMVVNNNVPARNLKEFIAYARANPGKLNFASGGNGGISHLMPEMFKQASGTFIVHIPYKGSAPALTDVMGGQAQMMADSIPLFTQYIKAGKVRALAVTSKHRSPALPDVPTMEEAGLKNFEVVGFYGMLAPSGTPKDVVARLSGALQTVLGEADTRAKLEQQGAEAAWQGPDAFGQTIAAEQKRWGQVIKASGAKID